MRSLGLSPTIKELTRYLRKKNGKMSFADFLDVMHQHSKVENLPDEVVNAFKAADPQGKGIVGAKQLRHLLQNWGEGLSVREVDNIFREANVTNNGTVRYSDFVKIACAPVPDYYWTIRNAVIYLWNRIIHHENRVLLIIIFAKFLFQSTIIIQYDTITWLSLEQIFALQNLFDIFNIDFT